MSEKTMTVADVAKALGVDRSTILNRTKELFPWLVKNGVNKTATRKWII